MIDTHTHLTSLEDPDAAIAAALEAGVHGMLSIGMDEATIGQTLEIARRHPNIVRVGAGVHPQQATRFEPDDWPIIASLCAEPQVAAIGETGLDQYRDYGPLDRQLELFRLHIELAVRLALPLIIHTRAAERPTLDALADVPAGHPVVLHCFSLVEQLDEVLERGYYCSFAGNVTYPSAQDLRDAAVRVPADRLLVETDAPYLAPVPMRGKPNQPAFVTHTLACVAAARGETPAQLEQLTNQNAERLFGFAAVAASA